MIDAGELAVVGELADELLLGVDLEDLGGGAEVAVAEPVHDDRVAVRQAFDGAGEVDVVIGDFVAADIPDDLAGLGLEAEEVSFGAEGVDLALIDDRRAARAIRIGNRVGGGVFVLPFHWQLPF